MSAPIDEAALVSAEEAQAILDTSPDLAEAVETGCDVLDNALTSGRQRAEVRRAMDLLCDVERLTRTVVALRAEHAAALDAARRKGAEGMRERAAKVVSPAGWDGDEFDGYDRWDTAEALSARVEALPLDAPGGGS